MLNGTVLGVDVGFSLKRNSTCFCRLSWNPTSYELAFESATGGEASRTKALCTLITPGLIIAAIALDGPLTRDLRVVTHYRAAEALLSRGVFQRRGKPGQTSSPTGQKLHQSTTDLAKQTLMTLSEQRACLSNATHEHAIVSKRLVENRQTLSALLQEAARGDLG